MTIYTAPAYTHGFHFEIERAIEMARKPAYINGSHRLALVMSPEQYKIYVKGLPLGGLPVLRNKILSSVKTGLPLKYESLLTKF